MTRHNWDHLGLRHPSGESYRLLPRHGEPLSIYEWVTQTCIKYLACFPIYFAVIVILTVVTRFWIVPLFRG